MKSHANLYRIIFFSLSLVISVGCMRLLFHTATTIKYMTFAFDPQLSPALCAAIKERVTLFQANNVYNSDVMTEQLLHFFPAIKSLELNRFPQHMALLTIKAFDPVIRINHDQLLIENQRVVPAAYYALHIVESLEKIVVATPLLSSINPAIIAAMKRCLAEKIFDHYTVYMANEYEWYLQDKQDPLFTVCCNASSLPLDAIRVVYSQLKDKIKKDGTLKNKWIADMRFQNQVILSMNKGGRYG